MSDYSYDVEIDHKGVLVATRDLEEGDIVRVPAHMFGTMTTSPELLGHTLRTTVTEEQYIALMKRSPQG